jgi:hypothetical protein
MEYSKNYHMVASTVITDSDKYHRRMLRLLEGVNCVLGYLYGLLINFKEERRYFTVEKSGRHYLSTDSRLITLAAGQVSIRWCHSYQK